MRLVVHGFYGIGYTHSVGVHGVMTLGSYTLVLVNSPSTGAIVAYCTQTNNQLAVPFQHCTMHSLIQQATNNMSISSLTNTDNRILHV